MCVWGGLCVCTWYVCGMSSCIYMLYTYVDMVCGVVCICEHSIYMHMCGVCVSMWNVCVHECVMGMCVHMVCVCGGSVCVCA